MNRVAMAAQGDELIIRAPVSAPLILGEVNGRADDVKETAMQSRLFPHWDYMGHKYDRAWKRILEAQEPLYVTFILTQSVDQGVVTSNKSPAISGKILKWELEKGEELIFTDGLAKLSFLRLNSYIPVDQIIIEAR